MLDIRFVRENPDVVRENIKKKFQNDRLPKVDEFLAKDAECRSLQNEAEGLRARRNKVSAEINALKKQGKDASTLLEEAKTIPEQLADVEQRLAVLQNDINQILSILPNIIHKSVPIGRDSSENVVREVIGEPRTFSFDVKSHSDIAEALDIADFETSAVTSGNGFFYLKGDLALLNMALITYAREHMIAHGYEYIEPPLMIRENILRGVYSVSEIAAMSYKIEGEDLFLIATSEHPLIGMFINKVIPKKRLPIKITAYSPCFRREIGSHGIDEKGLFRTHQFSKQEMVVICEPEDSYKFYDELLNLSKDLFKALGIPIRENECCSGDLGDLKAKSADLEAWSPRKNDYFEITSCTNMEAAQARRLNIRVSDGSTKYLAHTLNNTAIATSRAMVAILENFQNEDGSVDIPEVLQKYMGGKKRIEPKSAAVVK